VRELMPIRLRAGLGSTTQAVRPLISTASTASASRAPRYPDLAADSRVITLRGNHDRDVTPDRWHGRNCTIGRQVEACR
jgi:hypothetical protein